MTTPVPTTHEQMVDRAKEIKRKVEEALDPVLRAMDAAKAQGMAVNFNIAPDQLGRSAATISVILPLV